ncbi:uncharacterized protein LOC106175591 isoform X2 [Lingula anatina]|uniref:Uncharacterized protein LOC106175591 isoform X2 n=1 Tax=Lingula anatina TaxID=7574 RepID=A0A1S3JSV2_LINAN|nr:uncharacterized protein LOC106175591 isoform X2 [Lingula anatina]|eukprot:XP_013413114.1 uncharacterized protein LOC106175591 isoform X2 [Lingula anatina]
MEAVWNSRLSPTMRRDWDSYCNNNESFTGGSLPAMLLQYIQMIPECGDSFHLTDIKRFLCFNILVHLFVNGLFKDSPSILRAIIHAGILMIQTFILDLIGFFDWFDAFTYGFEHSQILRNQVIFFLLLSFKLLSTFRCNTIMDNLYDRAICVLFILGGSICVYIYPVGFVRRQDIDEDTYRLLTRVLGVIWAVPTAVYSLACAHFYFVTEPTLDLEDGKNCYVASATICIESTVKTMYFDMRSSVENEQMRRKITKAFEMDPGTKMRFKYKGQELDNFKRIFLDFDPFVDVEIHVIILHKLKVRYFGNQFVKVYCGRDDLISRLNTNIAETLQIPRALVRLMQNKTKCEEHRTCADYGLTGCSDTHIEPNSIAIQLDSGLIHKEDINIKASLGDYLKALHLENFRSLDVFAIHSETQESQGNLDPATPLYNFVNPDADIPTRILVMHGVIRVQLTFPSPELRYLPSQKHCLVHVESTIGALRRRLRASHIVFDNKDLSDDATIAECGLTDDALLFNDSTQKFSVSTPEGNNQFFKLRVSSTVRDLKEKIHAKTNINLEEQNLTYNGETLENDKRLFDYKIYGCGQSITLSKQSLSVVVSLPGNNSTTVKFQLHDTVQTLKRSIHEKTEISPEEQRLYLDSREIFDDSVLSEVGLTSDKSITLKKRKALKLKEEWRQKSIRWKKKFEDFVQLTEDDFEDVAGLYLCTKDPKFRISSGSESTEVYLGLLGDGTEVAVKRYLITSWTLDNELDLLLVLDHPRIVRYRIVVPDKSFAYLVLELGEYTLKEYIEILKRSNRLKEKGPTLVREIMEGLDVLHSSERKILHRDLKPQNVLIDCKGHAKLADFGIGRRLNADQSTLVTEAAGTLRWQAKETIVNSQTAPYRSRTDIQLHGFFMKYQCSTSYITPAICIFVFYLSTFRGVL